MHLPSATFMEMDQAYMQVKIVFDLFGYVAAALVTWIFSRWVFRKNELPNPFTAEEKRTYYLLVVAGAMTIGTIVSTFDGAVIPGRNPQNGILISKSIAGALFGGIVFAEIYKKIKGISIPTGILFLPGILAGVFVGRIGAIVIGIRDFTYGLPTSLPWWVNFWDGVPRHPTMIYEMILLLSFFLVFLGWLRSKQRAWWIRNGFYAFVIAYFAYRFLVWFIQPYSHWWWGLSTYQAISIPMLIYGSWMVYRHRNVDSPMRTSHS